MTSRRSEKRNDEAQISTAELSENELEKATGGSQFPSKCQFKGISITKKMDAASPGLF